MQNFESNQFLKKTKFGFFGLEKAKPANPDRERGAGWLFRLKSRLNRLGAPWAFFDLSPVCVLAIFARRQLKRLPGLPDGPDP